MILISLNLYYIKLNSYLFVYSCLFLKCNVKCIITYIWKYIYYTYHYKLFIFKLLNKIILIKNSIKNLALKIKLLL